jgi:membrane protein YdbS with pleckstrin-like domain
MPDFVEKVSYRLYRAWRFVKLNWRNLVVIVVAYCSVLVGLWSMWQLFTTKPGGMTAVFIFLIVACTTVFYVAHTSKRGRFDYLLTDDED